MTNLLDSKAVEEIAAEASFISGEIVDWAFIEKEWYAIQLLAHLNTLPMDEGVRIIFTGGTCLANAYGIIDRFSEDLDFIICSDAGEIPRTQRRRIRKSLLAHISQDERFSLVENSLKSRNESQFVQAHFNYPMNFNNQSLRPFLKLEVSFRNNRLDTSMQEIRSMVRNLQNADPEAVMECISPVETAADKVSALTWRLVVRDRSASDDDPTIIRHLHDLFALKDVIAENDRDFPAMAMQSLAKDQEERGGSAISNMTIRERLERALKILADDPVYAEEYAVYVGVMSYAPADKQVGFEDARANLAGLIESILGEG